MRIILHVGANKSGSSAVQEYLHRVKDEMPDCGFLYPDLGDRNHWKLAAALAPPKADGAGAHAIGSLQRRAAQLNLDPAAIKQAITEAIGAAPPDGTVVLSHENFSVPQRARAVAQFLAEIAPAAEQFAVGYIRSPITAYPSDVQELIKGRRPIVPPSDWLWKHPQRAAGLRRVFGGGAVVRAYDRDLLCAGDIVEDFRQVVAKIVGRNLPEAPVAFSTNTSLPGAACALLRRFGETSAGALGPEHGRLRVAAEQFAATRDDPKLRVPTDWLAIIAQKNSRDWNEAVEALPHDEPAKARLRLRRSDREVASAGDLEVRAWLDSYLGRDFIAQFVAFLEADTRLLVAAETTAWLRGQLKDAATGD